ncbi:MAG: D-xylose transport ATP-binding protein XylG [Actinomycetia bacterium]|nr:D-xylose transport ATP-binding protein XylG [Actinomycetes bacterium]
MVSVTNGAERDIVSGTPELSVSMLTVRFGALTALEGVSLALRAGEVVALAGENGAGKTTLIRSVAGDVTPASGVIRVGGQAVAPVPTVAAKLGVRVVWQDLSLADNLDVAANVMLGNERRRHLFSEVALHKDAASLLMRLGIPLRDTTRPVRMLSGGQRQMVAVARAMAHNPRILLLDEPTASLGVREAELVERLITRLRAQGTTILLSGHDTELMFRLADRIVVLRHGRVVTEVLPSEVRPDDVVALVSGQPVDSSARRQLTRLHGLAGRLVAADPSSSLSLILSALGAALGSERLAIHLPEDGALVRAASLGMPEALLTAWERLPFGAAGGPVGLAAMRQVPVIEENLRAGGGSWQVFDNLARPAKVASSWSVPVLGPGGLLGVITVFRAMPGKPRRDDLDLAALYAGYAASAIERDRLLDEVTARNRLLETIREMLQTLAGPVPVEAALRIALQALRHGLGADEVVLVAAEQDGATLCRGYSSAPVDSRNGDWRDGAGHPAGTGVRGHGGGELAVPEATLAAVSAVLDRADPDGVAVTSQASLGTLRTGGGAGSGRHLSVTFAVPDGRTVLLAGWQDGTRPDDATDLLEDAANSLRLALERERSLHAQQEAMALRQSRELQRTFLRRLSHELRTPLTAITGYATSLLQQDVTWDADSQQRFLSRIAAESARLGRLVNDLLDFSTIESGILRLNSDWCDIPLVLDAAVAVLPPDAASQVTVTVSASTGASGLPAIWADHDRLEQVFVNLLGNALGHNPPGTKVVVSAAADGPGAVTVRVADDGEGLPPELARAVTEAAGQRDPRWHDVLASGIIRPRRRGSGAGLGLSIASGIVAAHGGSLELEPTERGTCFLITLPVEKPVTMSVGAPAGKPVLSDKPVGAPAATTPTRGVKARD